MANTTNGSRKRTSTQANQDENETTPGDRRQRLPTQRQQQINDDVAAKLQATIERQKKELAKHRHKLARYEEVDEDENLDLETESQDEEDMGHGARAGGGFTSAITSKGTVPQGRSVAQKRQLVPETDPLPGEREPLQQLDGNHTVHSEPTADRCDDPFGANEEREPSTSTTTTRPSSPTLSLRSTPSLSLRAQYQRTMPRSQIRHDLERSSTPLSPGVFSQRPTPSSPHSELSRDLLAPSHTRSRHPPAPFRQGYTPGSKPKAADYEDGVEKMLLDAMHDYACLILTSDAFPNEARQTQWAEATWQAACKEVGVHYECSVRMIRLITSRGSWARGFLKDAARSNFKIFKFKEGSTEEIKRYNQDLRGSLLRDDAFHHKDQEAVTGFGEHRVVRDILRDALFEDNKSYGVKYSRYFDPISVNLLALVFTMIEFLIDEWSTGERKKATFRSRTYLETFEAHYLRTEQWCELEPTVTMNIRTRLFKTLMKKAGAVRTESNGGSGTAGMTDAMKERAKEALLGRTGDTDDEDDL